MDIKTTVITNDDGTTGYITNANKYQLSDDYLKKFQLLKKLSEKPAGQVTKVRSGGIGKDEKETANTNGINLLGFLTKMQKFHYGPPSDNLWTVEIDVMDKVQGNSSSGLVYLYSTIKAANEWWESISTPKWSIKTSKASKNMTAENYISQFAQSTSGLFLAQRVNFTPHGAQITADPFSQGKQHSGFLNFGYISQNRINNRSLKISFLVSNWDIGDILFDPWIAAITQRGTVETQQASLKAKIIIKEYSSGVPKQMNEGQVYRQMQCRKQYIFHNCVPINRSQVEKTYQFNDAGTFKTSVVEFMYDDYNIEYFI